MIRTDAPAPVWLNDDPYAAELSGADLTDHIMEQADVAVAGVPGDDGVLEVGQSPTAPDRISDLEQQARSTRRKSNTRDESPIDTNGWQHAAVAPAPPVTLPEWLKEEPYKVAHREYSTGFYYPDRKVTENTNRSGYFRSWLVVGEVLSWSPDEGGRVTLMSRNKIEPGQEIEFLLPGDAPLIYTVPENGLRDADGNWVQAINNPAHVFSMPCPHEVPVNAAIRSRTKHPTLKAA